MKVSFVIPVYNTEAYIDTCLSSIINQGLDEEEFEIVIVNDGSTDSSLEHCTAFARQHSNVVVISQKNSGVGMARNTGMEASHGDWICFVDSDDYLCSGGIKAVLSLVSGKPYNMVRFWSRIVSESFHGADINLGSINYIGNGHGFIKKFGMDVFCYTYLYDRKWLLQSGITFEDFRIAEDYLFVSKLLLLNPVIVSTTVRLYNYVKHQNSITGDRTPGHAASLARSYIALINNMVNYSSEIPDLDSELRLCVIKSLQGKMRSFMSRVLCSNIDVIEFKQMLEKLRYYSIIPLLSYSNHNYSRLYTCVINLIINHPRLLYLYRFIYRIFFVKYIIPRIDKNGI